MWLQPQFLIVQSNHIRQTCLQWLPILKIFLRIENGWSLNSHRSSSISEYGLLSHQPVHGFLPALGDPNCQAFKFNHQLSAKRKQEYMKRCTIWIQLLLYIMKLTRSRQLKMWNTISWNSCLITFSFYMWSLWIHKKQRNWSTIHIGKKQKESVSVRWKWCNWEYGWKIWGTILRC